MLTKGELVITDSVTINGPNDLSLTIDASGNDPTPNTNNGDGSRVFNIDNGSVSLADVAINLLVLTGGDASGSGGANLHARESQSPLQHDHGQFYFRQPICCRRRCDLQQRQFVVAALRDDQQ